MSSDNQKHLVVQIANLGDETVYLGPKGVTTLTGRPLGPHKLITFCANSFGMEPLFAITERGSANVSMIEIYVDNCGFCSDDLAEKLEKGEL